MIKRFLLIVSILFTVIANAQEGTSSPYSFYGVGLTTFKGTVENQSMGGLSMYADSIHVNLRNPAAYSKLALTTYTMAGSHLSATPKSEAGSGSSSATTIDYLAIGVPVGRRMGFGFGLVPYTSIGYNLYSDNQTEGRYGRFEGTGGINRAFLAAGYQLTNNFSLGAEVNYNFGNIENKNVMLQQNIQYGSREVNKSTLSGFAYNFSLNYEAMLTDRMEVRAMAKYTPETTISSSNERELATVLATTIGGEVAFDVRNFPVGETELTLPSEYTFGLGVGQARKWFVGAEYTNAEAAVFNNRSFMAEDATYTNSSGYRVGGFFVPDYTSFTSYLSRITYRAGMRMEDTGLRLNGEDIQEVGITFGVGLPAGRMLSNVNLGFEYGQRGTTNAGLVKEDFFKLSISLSLSDRWFIKRRYD